MSGRLLQLTCRLASTSNWNAVAAVCGPAWRSAFLLPASPCSRHLTTVPGPRVPPLTCPGRGRDLHVTAGRPGLLQIRDRHDFHERVILSPIPVIVNFHADWCDPCKELTPMLEKMTKDKRNINLCSLDIENHVDLLQDFEVQAVPAVLAFFNGQVVEKFVGLVSEQMVKDFVHKVINRLKAYSSLQAEGQEEDS